MIYDDNRKILGHDMSGFLVHVNVSLILQKVGKSFSVRYQRKKLFVVNVSITWTTNRK